MKTACRSNDYQLQLNLEKIINGVTSSCKRKWLSKIFNLFIYYLFGQFVKKFEPSVLRKCGREFQSMGGLSMLIPLSFYYLLTITYTTIVLKFNKTYNNFNNILNITTLFFHKFNIE